MEFDSARLRGGDWLVGIGALALFVSLFFFKWYGVGLPKQLAERVPGVSVSWNGWHTHTVLRWLMLATIVLALVLVVLRGCDRTLAWPIAPSAVLAGLAAVTTILAAFRVVIDSPGPDELISVKLGAWFGVLSLAAVTAGAYQVMGEDDVGPAPA